MTPTLPRKNNDIGSPLTLREIAELVGGSVIGDPTIRIGGVAGIKEAKAGDITFLSNPKYASFLSSTLAGAVVAPPEIQSGHPALVIAENPSAAFTKIISYFIPPPPKPSPGIHPMALVDSTAKLGAGVHVGAHVTIEAHVSIGDHAVIRDGCFIGRNAVLGDEVVLEPHVTILHDVQIGHRVVIHSGTVIGSEGFGYETVDGKHTRIPHVGTVVIEEDVEIGANVCVDRGRFDKTHIQAGVKIDNLVQVAHNVVIGAGSLIVSQAGISGSTTLGRGVILAGQAGLVGHIHLGDEVIVGAGAGVTKSFPEKTVILGSPAKPISEQKRLFALIARLPELFKDLAEIKKKIS